LPFFQVKVVNEKTIINVPSVITCIKDGISLPVILTVETVPFTNVTVAMSLYNNDKGIFPVNGSEWFTFTSNISSGYLQISCSPEAKSGVRLNYSLFGNNKDDFSLSVNKAEITVTEGTYIAGTPTLVQNLALTTVTNIAVNIKCSNIGSFLIHKGNLKIIHPGLDTVLSEYA